MSILRPTFLLFFEDFQEISVLWVIYKRFLQKKKNWIWWHPQASFDHRYYWDFLAHRIHPLSSVGPITWGGLSSPARIVNVNEQVEDGARSHTNSFMSLSDLKTLLCASSFETVPPFIVLAASPFLYSVWIWEPKMNKTKRTYGQCGRATHCESTL